MASKRATCVRVLAYEEIQELSMNSDSDESENDDAAQLSDLSSDDSEEEPVPLKGRRKKKKLDDQNFYWKNSTLKSTLLTHHLQESAMASQRRPDLCIDESLLLFKGRLAFKQYIPSKRSRFGLKSFVLCNVKTGLVLDIVTYTGSSTEINDSEMGYEASVVLTLLDKPDLMEKPRKEVNKAFRLCSEHFSSDSFCNGKTRLKADATPSVVVTNIRVRALVTPGYFRDPRSDVPEPVAGPSKGSPSSLHALEEEGTAPEMEAGMECSLLDTTDDDPHMMDMDLSVPQEPKTPETQGPKLMETSSDVPQEPGAPETQDPPKVAVSADNEVPGPSHGGHRTPVVTPKKAGRRGRVFTPRTQRRLTKLRSASSRYRKALNRLRGMKGSKKVSRQEALRNIKDYVPKELFKLLSAQVQLRSPSKKGRRWSEEVKQFALNLYFHGPKAYRVLSRVFELPTERSLRRLQQDPLENLFGIVRQQHGCNDNPTVFQFIAGLKHIMLGKLFKLSESTNCEDDTSFLLAELSTFPVSVLTTGAAQLSQASGDEAVQVYPSVSDTSPEVPDIVKDNVVYYVSGSLVKSFLRSKSADCVCERFLTDEGPEQLHGSHQFYSLLAANNVPESLFGDLTAPSDACYEYVQQLEARFLKKIDSLIHLELHKALDFDQDALRALNVVLNRPRPAWAVVDGVAIVSYVRGDVLPAADLLQQALTSTSVQSPPPLLLRPLEAINPDPPPPPCFSDLSRPSTPSVPLGCRELHRALHFDQDALRALNVVLNRPRPAWAVVDGVAIVAYVRGDVLPAADLLQQALTSTSVQSPPPPCFSDLSRPPTPSVPLGCRELHRALHFDQDALRALNVVLNRPRPAWAVVDGVAIVAYVRGDVLPAADLLQQALTSTSVQSPPPPCFSNLSRPPTPSVPLGCRELHRALHFDQDALRALNVVLNRPRPAWAVVDGVAIVAYVRGDVLPAADLLQQALTSTSVQSPPPPCFSDLSRPPTPSVPLGCRELHRALHFDQDALRALNVVLNRPRPAWAVVDGVAIVAYVRGDVLPAADLLQQALTSTSVQSPPPPCFSDLSRPSTPSVPLGCRELHRALHFDQDALRALNVVLNRPRPAWAVVDGVAIVAYVRGDVLPAADLLQQALTSTSVQSPPPLLLRPLEAINPDPPPPCFSNLSRPPTPSVPLGCRELHRALHFDQDALRALNVVLNRPRPAWAVVDGVAIVAYVRGDVLPAADLLQQALTSTSVQSPPPCFSDLSRPSTPSVPLGCRELHRALHFDQDALRALNVVLNRPRPAWAVVDGVAIVAYVRGDVLPAADLLQQALTSTSVQSPPPPCFSDLSRPSTPSVPLGCRELHRALHFDQDALRALNVVLNRPRPAWAVVDGVAIVAYVRGDVLPAADLLQQALTSTSDALRALNVVLNRTRPAWAVVDSVAIVAYVRGDVLPAADLLQQALTSTSVQSPPPCFSDLSRPSTPSVPLGCRELHRALHFDQDALRALNVVLNRTRPAWAVVDGVAIVAYVRGDVLPAADLLQQALTSTSVQSPPPLLLRPLEAINPDPPPPCFSDLSRPSTPSVPLGCRELHRALHFDQDALRALNVVLNRPRPAWAVVDGVAIVAYVRGDVLPAADLLQQALTSTSDALRALNVVLNRPRPAWAVVDGVAIVAYVRGDVLPAADLLQQALTSTSVQSPPPPCFSDLSRPSTPSVPLGCRELHRALHFYRDALRALNVVLNRTRPAWAVVDVPPPPCFSDLSRPSTPSVPLGCRELHRALHFYRDALRALNVVLNRTRPAWAVVDGVAIVAYVRGDVLPAADLLQQALTSTSVQSPPPLLLRPLEAINPECAPGVPRTQPGPALLPGCTPSPQRGVEPDPTGVGSSGRCGHRGIRARKRSASCRPATTGPHEHLCAVPPPPCFSDLSRPSTPSVPLGCRELHRALHFYRDALRALNVVLNRTRPAWAVVDGVAIVAYVRGNVLPAADLLQQALTSTSVQSPPPLLLRPLEAINPECAPGVPRTPPGPALLPGCTPSPQRGVEPDPTGVGSSGRCGHRVIRARRRSASCRPATTGPHEHLCAVPPPPLLLRPLEAINPECAPGVPRTPPGPALLPGCTPSPQRGVEPDPTGVGSSGRPPPPPCFSDLSRPSTPSVPLGCRELHRALHFDQDALRALTVVLNRPRPAWAVVDGVAIVSYVRGDVLPAADLLQQALTSTSVQSPPPPCFSDLSRPSTPSVPLGCRELHRALHFYRDALRALNVVLNRTRPAWAVVDGVAIVAYVRGNVLPAADLLQQALTSTSVQSPPPLLLRPLEAINPECAPGVPRTPPGPALLPGCTPSPQRGVKPAPTGVGSSGRCGHRVIRARRRSASCRPATTGPHEHLCAVPPPLLLRPLEAINPECAPGVPRTPPGPALLPGCTPSPQRGVEPAPTGVGSSGRCGHRVIRARRRSASCRPATTGPHEHLCAVPPPPCFSDLSRPSTPSVPLGCRELHRALDFYRDALRALNVVLNRTRPAWAVVDGVAIVAYVRGNVLPAADLLQQALTSTSVQTPPGPGLLPGCTPSPQRGVEPDPTGVGSSGRCGHRGIRARKRSASCRPATTGPHEHLCAVPPPPPCFSDLSRPSTPSVPLGCRELHRALHFDQDALRALTVVLNRPRLAWAVVDGVAIVAYVRGDVLPSADLLQQALTSTSVQSPPPPCFSDLSRPSTPSVPLGYRELHRALDFYRDALRALNVVLNRTRPAWAVVDGVAIVAYVRGNVLPAADLLQQALTSTSVQSPPPPPCFSDLWRPSTPSVPLGCRELHRALHFYRDALRALNVVLNRPRPA
ncbi:uncharacterized protein ISCGN_023906 [Ixodes scapularis]